MRATDEQVVIRWATTPDVSSVAHYELRVGDAWWGHARLLARLPADVNELRFNVDLRPPLRIPPIA